jgi:uncharacterized protein (TIGR04141 family)
MIFTVYYFNPNRVKSFADCYLKDKVTKERGWTRLATTTAQNNLDFTTQGFLQVNDDKTPNWVGFISQYFVVKSVKNVSHSLLLLIQIKDKSRKHYFALTGGQGHFAINRARIQADFGLKVVLNTVDPNKIGVTDSRNFAANQRHTRKIYSKGNSIQEFEFDEDEELLSLMSGKVLDKNFGKRVSGADSLHLSADLDFNNLGKKCQFLLKQFRSKTYKQTFPFYDKFKPIDDDVLIKKLETELSMYIAKNKSDYLSLSFPTIDDYQPTANYEFIVNGTTRSEKEFEIEEVLELIKDDSPAKIDYGYLSSITVIPKQGEHQVGPSFSLPELLAFEMRELDATYILSNRRWFQIEKRHMKAIEKAFDKIEMITNTKYLPKISKGETEGDYNGRLDSKRFCIYDKKNFQAPNSTSKIEVCDAFSDADKHLICVKKLKGSATLSHLFAQGSVSLSLLADYDKYREFFCKRTNDHFGTKKYSSKKLNVGDFKVVYAISSGRKKSLSALIPFFSKVNLLTHTKAIKTRGAKVALYKIEEN